MKNKAPIIQLNESYRWWADFKSLVIILLLLIPFHSQLFALPKPNKIIDLLYLEAKINYGFVIPHHIEIWGLTDNFFLSREISIFRQTDGRHDFHYMRNYPQIGITYHFTDFGGSKSLGVMNAVLPVIKIPVISKKNSKLYFAMGAGMAHLTKKFHPIENYQNLTIGSHLNAAVKFELSLQQKLSSRLNFTAGVAMFHVSNGTVKTPNYGLNIPSLGFGLQWKVTSKPIRFHVPEKLNLKKGKYNFRIMGSAASKQIINHPDKNFKVMAASGTLLYYYKNTARITFGGDLVYDESTKYRLEQQGFGVEKWTNVSKKGINIGHEWVFSRLAFAMSLGYYLHNPLKDDYIMYNKIGINYTFFNHFVVGINLQTHWAKADFLSFGIGLKI